MTSKRISRIVSFLTLLTVGGIISFKSCDKFPATSSVESSKGITYQMFPPDSIFIKWRPVSDPMVSAYHLRIVDSMNQNQIITDTIIADTKIGLRGFNLRYTYNLELNTHSLRGEPPKSYITDPIHLIAADIVVMRQENDGVPGMIDCSCDSPSESDTLFVEPPKFNKISGVIPFTKPKTNQMWIYKIKVQLESSDSFELKVAYDHGWQKIQMLIDSCNITGGLNPTLSVENSTIHHDNKLQFIGRVARIHLENLPTETFIDIMSEVRHSLDEEHQRLLCFKAPEDIIEDISVSICTNPHTGNISWPIPNLNNQTM